MGDELPCPQVQAVRLLGGCRSWLWQSTWGCWGQLGFRRAEALSPGVCSPALGAGETEVLSCAREGGLSRAVYRSGWTEGLGLDPGQTHLPRGII